MAERYIFDDQGVRWAVRQKNVGDTTHLIFTSGRGVHLTGPHAGRLEEMLDDELGGCLEDLRRWRMEAFGSAGSAGDVRK